ncbi:MAG: Efflux transporter, family, subunit [Myxococcales bacterium]|nr:Efflux transporter, family, subunit [Myxococcales bacterium]
MPSDTTPQDGSSEPPPAPKKRRPWRSLLAIVIVLILVVGAFAFGALPRIHARNTVDAETAAMAIPYVSVVRPEREAVPQDIVLPGNIQAYGTAQIFARTNGYLKRWNVDIGAHVKKGQVLAVIATPEVDQQLAQTRGTLAAAEANLRLAEETARRFMELKKTNAVSRQEVDNAVGSLHTNQATVQAQRATVRQLEDLQSFEQVRAPFDGVVTARNIDVGDLITSGATQTPLFSVLQADKLRVYVNVPEVSAQAVRPGLTADLALAAFPNGHFTGKLIRTADAIDMTTRTLLAEIEVDNSSGTLLPGAYAQVSLKVPPRQDTYILPIGVLMFRKNGLHVATVSKDHVVMKQIFPGRDYGDRIEVLRGLTGDEQVIMNPQDSITTGDPVRIAPPGGPAKGLD